VARRQSIGIRQELTSLIPTRQLNRLARLSGLVRRRRKIDPMELFWTVVLGFGAGRARTLAGMRRAYQKSTGATLVPSAFYDRFTESLAVFMRRVVEELLEKLQETEAKFGGLLRSFRDVVVTDSTLVKLHDLLEKRFPACRTNHTKAAAKLHVVMSVRGQGPRTVKLTSGRQHDGPVFRVGRWVRDRLLMFDLGYFRYQLFDCIDRNGGYFISRLKENANPEITATLRQWRGRSVPLVGERLRDVIERLQRETLDVEVEVAFRRRAYGGRRSGARRCLRLVGVKNEDTGRYHLYVTNIPPERLTAEQVARVYAGRWQIELLFKEMKSHYRLEDLPSRKPHIVEALLYATLVTLVVSRRLLRVVRQALRDRRRVVPEGRWAAIFASVSAAILELMLAPARLAQATATRIERMLLHEAIDPNLARQTLLARVENGRTW
jgi:putative transposase